MLVQSLDRLAQLLVVTGGCQHGMALELTPEGTLDDDCPLTMEPFEMATMPIDIEIRDEPLPAYESSLRPSAGPAPTQSGESVIEVLCGG